MRMKRRILYEPEYKKYGTGTIIKYNNETCLLMDNLIHTLDKNIIKVADKEYKSYGEFSLFSFLFERLLQWNIGIKGVYYTIRVKVPNKMIDRDNGEKKLKIKLLYNEFLNLYFILISNDHYHYYIYEFMETEYIIYEEKPYNDLYNYSLGDIYMKKSEHTLRTFATKSPFLINNAQRFKNIVKIGEIK